ncbi:hypothetical protein OsI_39045 [Oryza sativa Indica Group]|uniref:Uncharacterized protein n=1 Tax=Oryza sativa subsp. indica TaxID=39946 RepID=B8BMX3_ORYSI|nr:hypothetical protein OsI_39045 [Oryza sativa Indica Group]
MAWLGLANPDDELVPVDIPMPDIDPMHNPPPSGPKDGCLSPVIIHLDTLEDLQPHPMLYKQYEWLEPSAVRGPNEDPDGDGGRPHPRYQSRSRSLWGRITGRSHSSERGGDGQGFYNEDTRGCQRNRDTYITINHIRRSRDDTEVRAPISLSAAQKQKPKRGGSLAIDLSSSPAELFSFHHGDQGNQEQQEDPIRALTVRRRKMPFLRVEAAISFSPEGEHGVQGSPVYVPLSGGTVVTQAEDVNNNSAADLIASLTTPMIADLVEKGGCKKLKLKAAKAKAAVTPA